MFRSRRQSSSARIAPDARRGQGGQDRDRVDEALVEHAEDDVDGDERGQDQQGLVGERGLEGLRGALEAARGWTAGSADLALGALDGLRRRRPAPRRARG